ncbi:D-alanine--D-alanine ligase [Parasediminibacterium sp. JCM 36343]|uniref:D-alanine--D-alanine ligase n=1 Tax=Parasediminibacterium sp. JCM 36343 TaxID=3374279 RepID=UPI00397C3434
MKKRIALVTGGYSGEAQISYKSAITVGNNIDKEKYDIYTIDITPAGWWFVNTKGEKNTVNKEDFSISDNGTKITFDTILLCIHGTPGEDGKLQGYFDMLGLPYTSCDSATSALTFNKRYTVAVAAFGGICVAKSIHLFKHTPVTIESITRKLKLPVFVKPNNGGSSIGMSKVNDESEMPLALEKAFKEDTQILVEEYIKGREFTIGVFKTKGEIITLPITEVITKKEFFDFEAKYQGLSEEITPAILDESDAKAIRAAAITAYEVLNCRGVVRIDFILNEQDKQPYMLEVNTVPGQSAASIIPMQVKAMGWTLKDFYSAIIEEAQPPSPKGEYLESL